MREIVNGEDVFLWPDGDWCYRDEYEGMTHKSDDFEVVLYGSPRWHELVE